MKIRTLIETFPPSEQEVYLKVAEIIKDELGLGLVEIKNTSTVKALEKTDELILRFIKP